MYDTFYGLKERPFTLTPDPKYLFLSETHQEALNLLLYGINQREGFMVITGGIGTGKTTLGRTLLDRLGPTATSALIFNPILSEVELLKAILQDFGVAPESDSKKVLVDQLNTFLLQQLSLKKNVILILDESQNLSPSVLEQIRLLSNLETDKEKLLQIILVGQEELNQKLSDHSLRQLDQRVSVRYHLRALTKDETAKYIEHRLRIAGCPWTIDFSKGAIEQIYTYSGGTPRLINMVCDRTLLAGYLEQTNHITRALVQRGIESLSEAEAKPQKRPYLRPLGLAASVACLLLIGASLLLHQLGSGVPALLRPWLGSEAPGSAGKPSNPKVDATSGAGVAPEDRAIKGEGVGTTSEVTPGAGVAPPSRADAGQKESLYSVSMGFYQNRGTAQKRLQELKKKGVQGLIYSGANPGKTLRHWVLVGRFSNQKAAEELAARLKERAGFSPAEVLVIPSTVGPADEAKQ